MTAKSDIRPGAWDRARSQDSLAHGFAVRVKLVLLPEMEFRTARNSTRLSRDLPLSTHLAEHNTPSTAKRT